MLNLDTHILLFAVSDELTPAERQLLAAEEWSISGIVIWEIAKFAKLGRIELDLESADLMRLLTRLHVWPINLDVCRALEQLDFRSDPADDLIAATSIAHAVPLVTRDKRIRGSRVVPIARKPR
jgi:PIN domain nuclease of toxin-antitoxin system